MIGIECQPRASATFSQKVKYFNSLLRLSQVFKKTEIVVMSEKEKRISIQREIRNDANDSFKCLPMVHIKVILGCPFIVDFVCHFLFI